MKVQVKFLVAAVFIVSTITLLHYSGHVDVSPSQMIEKLPSIDSLKDIKTIIPSMKTTQDYSGDDVDPEIAATNKENGNRDLSSSLLDAPLPRRKFKNFAKYPPHNINEPFQFAYATLLCTAEPHEKDPFFAATQSLVWRILWSDWHSKYPMIVFVCPSTPQYQRDILAGQGAYVKPIELVTGVIDESALNRPRWRDQLTKINMWKVTEFKRILFLDSDAFPVQNVDDLFDQVPVQTCKRDKLISDDQITMKNAEQSKELCQYTFAGLESFNGGAFMFAPSLVWHAKLMRDLHKTDEYDFHTAEQGLLESSLAFGLQGAFPRYKFSPYYNADPDYYMLNKEKDLKVIHCKMWNSLSLPDDALNTRWDVDWMKMSRWYDGDIFRQARETGRRKEPLEVWLESMDNKVSA